jgi:hypothetical protein
MTDLSDLSTPQVLALMVVAEASIDERHGVPVDDVAEGHRFIYRALLDRDLIYVSSPRRSARELGLPDPEIPDAYVITDDGAGVVLQALRPRG